MGLLDFGVWDLDLDNNETWFDAISNLPLDQLHSAFDEVGDYMKRVFVQSRDVFDCWDTSQHIIDACVMVHILIKLIHLTFPIHAPNPEDPTLDILPTLYESHAHEINKHVLDYLSPQPMFGWLPAHVIKQTSEVTAQYA